ncbi:MAG: PH domain-containing protein [Bacteroidetes bacterium]|jgi:membrane protein YdbS with pleckstrin-like domain|nr:PH domain-containing protein [Bacteroidota bacterium]
MEFSNDLIDWSRLPQVQQVEFAKLSTNFRLYSMIRAGISSFFWAVVFLLSIIFIQLWELHYILAMLLFWLFLTAFLLLRAWKLYAFKGYALREHDMLYKSGWIWKRLVAVPYNRIQHVEVRRGPIEEMLDLRKLQIFTAGGSASDLNISGLAPEQAEQLRLFISEKTGLDEEE